MEGAWTGLGLSGNEEVEGGGLKKVAGVRGSGVGWHYEMGHSRACGTHEIARRRADRRLNCKHLVLGEVQKCEAGARLALQCCEWLPIRRMI